MKIIFYRILSVSKFFGLLFCPLYSQHAFNFYTKEPKYKTGTCPLSPNLDRTQQKEEYSNSKSIPNMLLFASPPAPHSTQNKLVNFKFY
jgi:hypothetical protein